MKITEKLINELQNRFLIFAVENDITAHDMDNKISFIGGFKAAIELLTSTEVISDISDRMDDHARSVDDYCYGLPRNNSDLSEYINIIHIAINNFKSSEVEEVTIPITYGLIKNTCGWGRYCDVTNGNHWAANEFSIDDNEIFHVKLSHAKELGFVK